MRISLGKLQVQLCSAGIEWSHKLCRRYMLHSSATMVRVVIGIMQQEHAEYYLCAAVYLLLVLLQR